VIRFACWIGFGVERYPYGVQEEDAQNGELLDLPNQILALTKAVHAYAAAAGGGKSTAPDAAAAAPAKRPPPA